MLDPATATGATEGTAIKRWRRGNGAPSSSLGTEGDCYFDNETGDIFLKWPNAFYNRIANIKNLIGFTDADVAHAPAEIKKRHRAFDKLLDEVVEKFKIDDRAGLRRAIAQASLVRYGRGGSRKADRQQLAKLEKLTTELQELLGREDAIQRITGMLIDRDHLLVHGHDPTSEPGEDDRTTRRMTAIAGGLLSGKKFSELALVLKAHSQKERKRWRQSGNVPDVTLYGMLRALQRFWWNLPGYRERAKSDELNFLQRVVAFIDPAAVSKVPSAMRRRVKLDPPL